MDKNIDTNDKFCGKTAFVEPTERLNFGPQILKKNYALDMLNDHLDELQRENDILNRLYLL